MISDQVPVLPQLKSIPHSQQGENTLRIRRKENPTARPEVDRRERNMEVNLIPVKCPECGSTLKIEDFRTHAYCSYCGAEVLIHNENEYTVRHIDEADLKKAETDRLVKLKQIELYEKETNGITEAGNEQFKKAILCYVFGSLIVLIFGCMDEIFGKDKKTIFDTMVIIGTIPIIIGTIIGANYAISSGKFSSVIKKYLSYENEEEIKNPTQSNNVIHIPDNVGFYKAKSYKAIAILFKSAGFRNITCVALEDLHIAFILKPGMVQSISINGRNYNTEKSYPKDAAVVILFHSMA